jgi:DNA transposition AAA+ family ATPase
MPTEAIAAGTAPETVATSEMLPNQPDKTQFIDQVNQFLVLNNWKAEKLAKSAGISPSALSQFLSFQYKGNFDNIKQKLLAVIEREACKATIKTFNPNFIETSVSKRFNDVANICRFEGEFGLVYADAGTGKTESAREYTAKRSDVILIEADPGYTPTVLFRELHQKLGNSGKYILHDTFKECVDRLQNSGRLLIIDEAEQLSYKALELLRRLYDNAGIGILMTGMPRLLENIRGYRGDYAQIYSRIGIAARIQQLTEDDTKNIVTHLTGDTNNLWRVFHKESKGNARRLFKLVKRAIYISDLNKVGLDTEVVMHASSLIKVEVMS